MTVKEPRKLVTVKKLSELYSPFSQGSIRSLIFQAKHNGLEPALLRIGRRVLIDADKFEAWLEEKSK